MGFFKALWTTCKVVGVTAKVTGGVAVSTLRGVNNTLQTTAEALDKINRKDWDGLGELTETKFEQLGHALENKIEATCELGQEIEECLRDKNRPFLTAENTRRLTAATTMGIGLMSATAAGASIADLDADDVDADSDANVSSDLAPYPDHSGEYTDTEELAFEEREPWADYPTEPGYGFEPSQLSIDDGVFVGDAAELADLAQMGQIEGTTHIDAEDITRDLEARDAFLESHGYDSVPEGWEVHHVIPLSEGGSDTPDNMILVREDDHDYITASHARFYGWRTN